MNAPRKVMDTRSIPTYQLVISTILLFGTISTAWVNLNGRVTVVETKQLQQEAVDNRQSTETSNFRAETREAFKQLNEGQNQILIQMKDKQDRK